MKERKDTFAEKVKKTPSPPTTIPTAPINNNVQDGEADIESESETTWKVVAPRRKRKRQGPTPRTSPACPAAEDSFYERATMRRTPTTTTTVKTTTETTKT